jgi:hypothetical protein
MWDGCSTGHKQSLEFDNGKIKSKCVFATQNLSSEIKMPHLMRHGNNVSG